MRMDIIEKDVAVMEQAAHGMLQDDPLDRDAHGDELIVTTRRSLLRVALVATETATRFERERIEVDPMAWMLAPRRLFDGRSALDGCLGRDECLRAILLHGLSLGLDADPDEIDALGREDEDEARPDEGDGMHHDDDGAYEDNGTQASALLSPLRGARRPQLFTSLLVARSGADEVQAFDAVVADDRAEAEARLLARHGNTLAGSIEIVEGFDPTQPLVEALVSSALTDMLMQVAGDPACSLAKGLSVSVRQRFAA